MELERAGLLVESLERAEFFVAPELCLADSGLQETDRLVVHSKRHRERMPIFAAMRE